LSQTLRWGLERPFLWTPLLLLLLLPLERLLFLLLLLLLPLEHLLLLLLLPLEHLLRLPLLLLRLPRCLTLPLLLLLLLLPLLFKGSKASGPGSPSRDVGGRRFLLNRALQEI